MRTTTTRRAAAATLLLATAMLTACSGDEADGEAQAVSVEVEGGATSNDPGGSTDSSATTDEEAALAFAECMRGEGIDFPDPTVGADGSIELVGGGGPQALQGQDGVDEAFEACQGELGDAAFLPGGDGAADQAEIEDTLLGFAECLRDQGLDVDDPQVGGGFQPGAGGGGLFGDSFDPEDPANADAIEACQDELVGLPFGGGQ